MKNFAKKVLLSVCVASLLGCGSGCSLLEYIKDGIQDNESSYNSANSVTVLKENVAIASELYSTVSVKEENENNYALKESFRDDYYWYYIYYLGCVHRVPVGDITTNWFKYSGGAEITSELKITEMSTEKVAMSIEKSNGVTDGWSKDISTALSASLSTTISQDVKIGVEGGIGVVKANAETNTGFSITGTLEAGLEEKFGITSSAQNTLSQLVENSKETTLVTEKTMSFTFVPNVTAPGFYNYITLGTADVFGLVIYDPVKNAATITSISSWKFLYDELVYSKDEYSASSMKVEKLEMALDELTFEKPTTYYETVNKDQLTPVPDSSKKTIYLNANGGFVAQTSIKVAGGQNYGQLPVPEKSGYIFLGWYTESSGGNLVTPNTKVQFEGDEKTLYALWTTSTTTVTLGSSQAERHQIRLWSSWGHNDNMWGEDTIHTEWDRDSLIAGGYNKIKVSMTFEYRVDDWGDQLIQILAKNNNEVKRFEYEWKERGWTNQTVEFELSLADDVTADCGFGIKWYLFRDGQNSDTWFVGKTTLNITAIK